MPPPIPCQATYTVKVDPRLADLVETRTRPIRRHWERSGRNGLEDLCQSCYLQGVKDAFEVIRNDDNGT